MLVVEAVFEAQVPEGFTLWPVAPCRPYSLHPLNGTLSPAEVGTAVASFAHANDIDPERNGRPPRPADPIGAFLHGLLTMHELFAAGGIRVTDACGAVFEPGCCEGLEDRAGWRDVIDGPGTASFGHDPTPLAERRENNVVLTIDAETPDSPTIELPAATLREHLAAAERDLAAFLTLVPTWAAHHLGGRAEAVTAVVTRALVLPEPCP